MKLGLFLIGEGRHIGAWHDPSVPADAPVNLKHFCNLAQIAERGLFDLVFLADASHPAGPYDLEYWSRTTGAVRLEPITLLTALAAVTKNIGLVATASTETNHPYNVARLMGTLDVLSGGRAGWNVVASANDLTARNFGIPVPSYSDRYTRAAEFVDIVFGLWDTYAPDAFVYDRENGRYFDKSRMHVFKHKGKFFSAEGPLIVPPSPQERPVIVQAGQSEEGKEVAAKYADVVFTVQQNVDDARILAKDIKGRAVKYGRLETDIKIMPGIVPVVGDTPEDAQAKLRYIESLLDPYVGLSNLSALLGTDMSQYDFNGPVPDLPAPSTGGGGRQRTILDLAKRESLTVRDLCRRVSGDAGHQIVAGTPEMIADHMEEWCSTGAADGFNVMPQMFPASLIEFVDRVVPVLQRRGSFRTEYEGQTLRKNLGLRAPMTRWNQVPA